MTLVLAAAFPDIAFMVADTLLSSELKLKWDSGIVNGETHALKVHVFESGDLAVGFAGDVGTARSILQDLSSEIGNVSPLSVCDFLYDRLVAKLTGTPSRSCDFLVLQIRDGKRELHLVDTAGVAPCQTAYIGDPEQYRELRRLQALTPYRAPPTQWVHLPNGTFALQSLGISEGEQSFAEIGLAMERLTHARRSETVGAINGCVVRVVDARISGKFEYLQYKEASVNSWEGNTSFHFLASNRDRRGIGLYYQSGCMGFIMITDDHELCRKEYAESVEAFARIAFEKYGLNLE